jgi:hypothetical protein
MKIVTPRVVLTSAALALAGCASPGAAQREHETLVSMSYTGELLQYRCGGYRRDVGAPIPCHGQRLPEGYSKDSAGYRTGSAPVRPGKHAPTPTGYVVKAYRIGPHVDPSNPRLVQGAHTAYQVVGEPGWNLHTARRVNTPVPEYAPPTRPERPARVDEDNRRAAETDRRTQELQQRVSELEQAQRVNAATQNANQQLLVNQINALKARAGQPQQPTQADPNQP